MKARESVSVADRLREESAEARTTLRRRRRKAEMIHGCSNEEFKIYDVPIYD